MLLPSMAACRRFVHHIGTGALAMHSCMQTFRAPCIEAGAAAMHSCMQTFRAPCFGTGAADMHRCMQPCRSPCILTGAADMHACHAAVAPASLHLQHYNNLLPRDTYQSMNITSHKCNVMS